MKIKIGWMNCTVKNKKDLMHHGTKCDGLFNPRKKLILIEESLPKDLKKKTLLHELYHALLFSFGSLHWDDESLVEQLASGTMCFMEDNKGQVSKLVETLCK